MCRFAQLASGGSGFTRDGDWERCRRSRRKTHRETRGHHMHPFAGRTLAFGMEHGGKVPPTLRTPIDRANSKRGRRARWGWISRQRAATLPGAFSSNQPPPWLPPYIPPRSIPVRPAVASCWASGRKPASRWRKRTAFLRVSPARRNPGPAGVQTARLSVCPLSASV